MRKTVFILALAMLLLMGTIGPLFMDYAVANLYTPLHLPKITINSDGSISPKTSYITKTGNIYTLTADIIKEYAIEILCSNIVFDGAGHTVDVAVEGLFSDHGYPAIYMDVGINLLEVHNVIVKNVTVRGNNENNINLQFCNNCQIIGVTTSKNVRILGDSNSLTDSSAGVVVWVGTNNLITRNNINFVFVTTGSNRFYLNNFNLTDYAGLCSSNFWDNGTVGNYWRDYTTKYPNATELGDSGIGDTPYVIQRDSYTMKQYPNAKNIDNFPLWYPYGPPEVTVFCSKNISYVGDFPLNFSVNKPTRMISYSLDQGDYVTIDGNLTLKDLPTGCHSLTIFTTDIYGVSGVSEKVIFTIVEPEHFPVMPITAAFTGVAVAAICLGLFAYFKKHKRQER